MIASHWDHQYHPSRALYGPKNTWRGSCSSWEMGFSWHRREIWDGGIFGNFQTTFARIWCFGELFCPPLQQHQPRFLGWMNFSVGLGQGKADPDPTAQRVQEKYPGPFGITAGVGTTSWILWDCSPSPPSPSFPSPLPLPLSPPHQAR